MQFQICARGVSVTEQLKNSALEKMGMALNRLQRKVTKITMYLFDANGPQRGGEDQVCRLVVQIQKQKAIVLEDRATNLGLAIERISDRLSVTASRRADRMRDKRSVVGRRRPITDSVDASY